MLLAKDFKLNSEFKALSVSFSVSYYSEVKTILHLRVCEGYLPNLVTLELLSTSLSGQMEGRFCKDSRNNKIFFRAVCAVFVWLQIELYSTQSC